MQHGADLQAMSVIVSLARIRERHLDVVAAIDRSISRLRGELSPCSCRTLDRLILTDSEQIVREGTRRIGEAISEN